MLVNNAGYGLMGAFEDLLMEEIKAQFETNLFGLIRTTQAVLLRIMRKQNSGFIVNISSGAGRFGFPGGSVYVSTKFAVEGLSESMSYELEPFGIKVILIEPGFVKTNFHQAMIRSRAVKNEILYDNCKSEHIINSNQVRSHFIKLSTGRIKTLSYCNLKMRTHVRKQRSKHYCTNSRVSIQSLRKESNLTVVEVRC